MSNEKGNLPGFELNRKAHEFDDVDKKPESHHHTIGKGPNQVASGKDLVDLTSTVTGLTTPTWQDVTFQNSFANFGTPYRDVQFAKTGEQLVFKGLAKHATTSTTGIVFILPEEFRPSEQIHCDIFVNAGAANCTIETNGEFTINSYKGGGTAAYVEFDRLAVFL